MLFSGSLFMVMMFFGCNFKMSLSLLLLVCLILMNLGMGCEYSWCYMYMYIDMMSLVLVILSVFIVFLMNLNDFKINSKKLNLINMSLMFALFFCFFSSNMLMLYIFFEVSLVPLVVLILLKGSSPERLISSIYLVMFTLGGSLPLLVMLVFLLNKDDTNILMSKMSDLSSIFGVLWWLMIVVFLVKMPMYGVHLWLPKAHVEAPVTGSMILAGLLLKLGGFGLFRLFNFLSMNNLKNIKPLIMIISLMGGVLISFLCFRQIDIKLLVAYSSVTHMGAVLGGIFSLNLMGSMGAIGAMIGHGFCSSGLFYLANWFYERYKTRSMMMMKGAAQIFPLMLIWWMLFAMVNMGVPPFLNFFSELLLMYSIMKYSAVMVLILSIILVVGVFYSLCLFTRLSHGMWWKVNFMHSSSLLEMLVIWVHFLPLIFYLMNVGMMLESL